MSSDDRIRAARQIVAAPLLVTLSDICDINNEGELAKDILATLPNEFKQRGELVLTGAGLKPYSSLHLCLSKVPKGYQFSIRLPSKAYETELKTKFPIFTTAAVSYWKEWVCAHPELTQRIQKVINIDKIYNTDTVLFWNRSDPYWIGIIAYFIDEKGNIYKDNI
jgi:hypothetical protein